MPKKKAPSAFRLRDRFTKLVVCGDYDRIHAELDTFIKAKVDFDLRTPAKMPNATINLVDWLVYNSFRDDLIRVLEAGASPDLLHEQFGTPLGRSSDNDPEIVEILLRYGADPNKPGRAGMTPLQIAVYGINAPKAPACFKLLLAHGADPELVGGRWGGMGSGPFALNEPASPLKMARGMEIYFIDAGHKEQAKGYGAAIRMMKAKIEEKTFGDELTAKTTAVKRKSGI